ncbi:MAG TPA: GAF domain-containing protein [Spirochaetota bacterium]|nr:GAF domain-containing protein [Spirochaetota bacterium]HPN81779.1 GAF domain-containing protein [Spirochaetota bacterium]
MPEGMFRNYRKRLSDLLKITEDLNHVKDIDALLDKILYEARQFTNADAGSIYLREGDQLRFSYVQNDTLAGRDPAANKHLYSTQSITINDASISGYVALTGRPLLISDVYDLGEDVPYRFNRSFDEKSNYRTKSILTVPLVTSRQDVIGVMQIINSRNKNGVIKAFSRNDMMYVNFFANNASVAIERAKMTREIILRMIRMAELRDPKETGNHVNRVSAYAIEIYEKWAQNKGIERTVIKKVKDTLRISAMLHDVGKVAISDTILKKPGKLTEAEYAVMKTHTLSGARLFDEAASDWDALAAEVALTHHERWDGQGYPGNIEDVWSENHVLSKGLAGEDIPISGRIVALADVYDALISKRVYKDAWDEDQVLEYLKNQSGSQFDPDVVDAFLSIYAVIRAIRDKYAE